MSPVRYHASRAGLHTETAAAGGHATDALALDMRSNASVRTARICLPSLPR